MNRSILITLTISLALIPRTKATDTFPVFQEAPFSISIPTNMLGHEDDSVHVVGSNFVYTIIGQIFTNAASGHIQTLSEGFSGTNSDRSTPWKTLTELLAVYHQGAASNAVAALYAPSSQSFLDSVYTNAEIETSFQLFATSITNMNILLGYEATNGFIGVTSYISTNSATPETLPFYFINTNGEYLLSPFDNQIPRDANIGTFLNTHSVTNLIQ